MLKNAWEQYLDLRSCFAAKKLFDAIEILDKIFNERMLREIGEQRVKGGAK